MQSVCVSVFQSKINICKLHTSNMYIVEYLNMIGWNLNSLNPTYNNRNVVICTLIHYGRKAISGLAALHVNQLRLIHYPTMKHSTL